MQYSKGTGLCVLSYAGQYTSSHLMVISLLTVLTSLLLLLNAYCWRLVTKVTVRPDYRRNPKTGYLTSNIHGSCQSFTTRRMSSNAVFANSSNHEEDIKVHVEEASVLTFHRDSAEGSSLFRKEVDRGLYATLSRSVPTMLNTLCKETLHISASAANSAPNSPSRVRRVIPSIGRSTGLLPARICKKDNKVAALKEKIAELSGYDVYPPENTDSARENSTSYATVNSFKQNLQILNLRGRKYKRFYRTLAGVSTVSTLFLVTWIPVMAHYYLTVLAHTAPLSSIPWFNAALLCSAGVSTWCNLVVYWAMNLRK